MNVLLDVPVGQWRHLTAGELATINKMVSTSDKTAPQPKSLKAKKQDVKKEIRPVKKTTNNSQGKFRKKS